MNIATTRTTLPLLAAAILSLLPLAAQAAGGQAPSPSEHAAATTLRARFGERARVQWPQAAKRPAAVRLLDEPTEGATPALRAASFLERSADPLVLRGIDLVAMKTERTRRAVVVRFRQEFQGIPVYQRGATVTLDEHGERVRAVAVSAVDVSVAPDATDIGPEAAVAAARDQARAVLLDGAQPSVAKRILAGPPDLVVYQVVLPTIAPFGRVSLFVDATTGALVWQRHDAIR